MSLGAADASLHVEVLATDSKLRRVLETSKRDMRQWGREMRTLGSGLTFNPITAGIAAIGVVASNTYAEYEKHINRVQAVTGATVDTMGKLRNQALSLGKETIFSALQAAEGMGFLGMAGFEALEVFKAMPGVTKLAAIGMTDVSKAADIATNILLGFGLQVENLARVNDVLAAAITDSNTDLRKMGSALSYAAPLAKAAGWSLEEASAAIMSVSDAGIQGTRAGTSLRNMIMRLTKPSAKAAEIMKYLGINVLDSSGQLKDLDKIIEEFTPHMEKAGEMAAIFGARAAPGMLKILRSGVDDFRGDVEKLITSFGLADQMSDVMIQGFYGKWVRLKSAVHTLGIEIGEALSGPIGDIAVLLTDRVIPAVADLVDWFEDLPRPIQHTAIAISALFAAIGPLLWAFGPMAMGLGMIIETLGKFKLAGGVGAGLSKLRALVTGVGVESNKTAKAIAGVATAAAAASSAYATWGKGGRPHPGVIRTRPTGQGHGLFKRDVDDLGGGVSRVRPNQNIIGTNARNADFGLKIPRATIESLKAATYQVRSLGNGVTQLVSKGDDTRSLSEKLGALAKKGKLFKELKLSISGVGVAITGVSLVSEKFANLTDSVFGVALSIIGAGFRGIGNDIKSLVGLIGGAGSAIIGWWGDLRSAVDTHVIPDWVGDLTQKLRDYKEFLDSVKPSGFFGAKVDLESPDVPGVEGWGTPPESMRSATRLPTPYSDRRYDFSSMTLGLAELQSRVRKVREEFMRGEASIDDYQSALSALSEGQKGRAFLSWLRGGNRSIEDQVKWLAEYGNEVDRAAEALKELTEEGARWLAVQDVHQGGVFDPRNSRQVEAVRSGLGAGMEAGIGSIQSYEDAFADDLRTIPDIAERIGWAAGQSMSMSFNEAFRDGSAGEIPRSMMTVAGDGSLTVPGGTGLPGPAFPWEEDETEDASKAAEEFDRMFSNLAHTSRQAGGEVAGAFVSMSQVAIVSVRAMADGINKAEMASIILAVISAVINLGQALGIAGKTAESITDSYDDLSSSLDNVRSGAYSASEALEQMTNWSGNQEGFDFLRNMQKDAEAVGMSVDHVTTVVGDLWDAMRRMDENDEDSPAYAQAADDYARAAEELIRIADAARVARMETEAYNEMVGIMSQEQVETLDASTAAWNKLTEEQKQSTRAIEVYAEALIDARDAGHTLTEEQTRIIEQYEKQKAAVDNLDNALRQQFDTYFSLADNAKETYEEIYNAAIESGKSKEEASRIAAEYQNAMAEWTMEVEKIKFQRMVFLDELLRQIRIANQDEAATAAEDAARRAVEAWAKASDILNDPAVQKLLDGFKLPDRPVRPSIGGGGRGGGGGGASARDRQGGILRDMLGTPSEDETKDFEAAIAAWGQLTAEQKTSARALEVYVKALEDAKEAGVALTEEQERLIERFREQQQAIAWTADALQAQIDNYFNIGDVAEQAYDKAYDAAIEAGMTEEEARTHAAEHAAEMAAWMLEVEELKFKKMIFLEELLKQIREDNASGAVTSAEDAARRATEAWARAAGILDDPRVREILKGFDPPDAPDHRPEFGIHVSDPNETEEGRRRHARAVLDYFRQMSGGAQDAVNDLDAAEEAWGKLDGETRSTSRAIDAYADALQRAKDAGVELSGAQEEFLRNYRRQKEAIELLDGALKSQLNTYFSIADNAESVYDSVYKAALKAGKSEEEAAEAAAKHAADMAAWTMEVEEIKFKRMVFLDELLRQIRMSNEDDAALSAERAADRAVKAWARANEILEAPGVRDILDGFKLPSRPGMPFEGAGAGTGGGMRVTYGVARATGGSALAGMDYVVGDAGPEILRMGARSGEVVPMIRYQSSLNGYRPPMTGFSGAMNGGARMVRREIVLVDAQSRKELARGIVDDLQSIVEERGY